MHGWFFYCIWGGKKLYLYMSLFCAWGNFMLWSEKKTDPLWQIARKNQNERGRRNRNYSQHFSDLLRTRLSTSSHLYSVHLPNARVNQYLHSFIPCTGKPWNSLPLSVFPPAYDLNSFKRGVSRHLTLSWTSSSCLYFSYYPLYSVWRQAGFLKLIFVFP